MAKEAPSEERPAYLDTKIVWGQFGERPADESKLQTIGNLKQHAASIGLSIFDMLRNVGLSSVAADDVLRWMDLQRETGK